MYLCAQWTMCVPMSAQKSVEVRDGGYLNSWTVKKENISLLLQAELGIAFVHCPMFFFGSVPLHAVGKRFSARKNFNFLTFQELDCTHG